MVDRQSSAARVIAQTRRRNEDLDNTRLLLYSATASYRRSVLPDSHLIGAVLNAVGHHSRLVKDGEALANLADLLSDESQTGQAMVECNRLVLTIGMMLGDG